MAPSRSPSPWRRLASFLAAGLRGVAGPVIDPSMLAGALAQDRESMAADVERFAAALRRGEIGADDFAR
jgi:hypothetical protein